MTKNNQLHVGDSAFETWYSTYEQQGISKQVARDAYAAGMSDPLVVPNVEECELPDPFGYLCEWRSKTLGIPNSQRFYEGEPGNAIDDDWNIHPDVYKNLPLFTAEQMREAVYFYKRRVDALQQHQSKMRDPERTIVCDIIANGCTLEPLGDRYK